MKKGQIVLNHGRNRCFLYLIWNLSTFTALSATECIKFSSFRLVIYLLQWSAFRVHNTTYICWLHFHKYVEYTMGAKPFRISEKLIELWFYHVKLMYSGKATNIWKKPSQFRGNLTPLQNSEVRIASQNFVAKIPVMPLNNVNEWKVYVIYS